MGKDETSRPDGEREATRRTILVVDSNWHDARALQDAWDRLGLLDELRVVGDRVQALEVLRRLNRHKRADKSPPVAAVVLDPEMTGETTGDFMRAVRRSAGRKQAPVLFWTRDGEKYEVLEGRGVESVLPKETVLRLIQTLDEVCSLRSPHSPQARRA